MVKEYFEKVCELLRECLDDCDELFNVIVVTGNETIEANADAMLDFLEEALEGGAHALAIADIEGRIHVVKPESVTDIFWK